MDLKSLIGELLGELGRVSKADGVVGTVRDAGTAKVLPLSKISIAFGTAIGDVGGSAKRGNDERDGDAEVGGAGGAIVVEPRAFVVVGEDGEPHMLALHRGRTAVVRKGIEIMGAPVAHPEALPGSPAAQLGSGEKK
ncbi:MAG: spore germination protein GerW family protein [Polyangiaceae bacterium]